MYCTDMFDESLEDRKSSREIYTVVRVSKVTKREIAVYIKCANPVNK